MILYRYLNIEIKNNTLYLIYKALINILYDHQYEPAKLKITLFSELKDLYKQNLNFKIPLDGNQFERAFVKYYENYIVINFGY